jgi:hypothetical protein
MSMQQTHYDTLKVSRDAPIEVIRAAYRVLSQKYHPDRNPADSAAADTMGLLNNAYEILSDPERRHAHDAWIRYVEAESLHVRKSEALLPRPERIDTEQELRGYAPLTDRIVPHLRRFGLLYGIALLVSGVAVVSTIAQRPQESPWLVAAPAPEDREALIRRLASEVMMRPSDGAKISGADPQPAGSVPTRADDSPLSAAASAKRAPVRAGGDAARPRQAARAAALPDEWARSSPDLPADAPPHADSQPIVRPAPPNHIQAPGQPLPEERNP